MKKFLLTFSVLALFAVAADAAPRVVIGGGGGRGYGGGGFYGGRGYGGYNGFYGPGYGYNPGIRVAPGVRIGGGYYGNGYGGYNSFYGPGYGGYGYGRTGLWFGSGLYGSIPLTARGGYGNATYVVPSTTIEGVETIPQSNTLSSGTAGDEWGLKVTQVMDGGAARKADLRAGDIILGVGQTRTQTLSELQQALASARGKVDLVFINQDNKKIEKIPVTPADGKIGVAVEPVDLP